MKNCSGISSDLERSMNMTSRIMTFEECLRNAEVIDLLDDKRRVKMFNLLTWNNDMLSNFIDRLDKITFKEEMEILIHEAKELQKNMKNFAEKFKKSIEVVKRDELQYEQMDDNLRNYLVSFAIRCREQLKQENSEIEAKMILENLKKRKEIND